MSRNIEMNYRTESGYEVLYPQTLPELTGCLPLTGGTMTGPIVLNGDATENLQPVTLQQMNDITDGVIRKVTQSFNYNFSFSSSQTMYKEMELSNLFDNAFFIIVEVLIKSLYATTTYTSGNVVSLSVLEGTIYSNSARGGVTETNLRLKYAGYLNTISSNKNSYYSSEDRGFGLYTSKSSQDDKNYISFDVANRVDVARTNGTVTITGLYF